MLESCAIADRFTYNVHSAAIDEAQRLTIPALVRELQAAAMRNSVRLGFSVFELEAQNLGWVLLRQSLRLSHRPKLGESYEVLTCPAGFDRFFTYRDFHLFDQNGQIFGTATTAWMMMDLTSRRMTAVPDWIKDRVVPHLPAASQLLPQSARMKLQDLPGLLQQDTGEKAKSLQFRVGYHQLDFNRHLSNPFYLEWGLEGLPQVLLSQGDLIAIDLEYKKEAVYGEQVQVRTALDTESSSVYRHLLTNERYETLAIMRSQWK